MVLDPPMMAQSPAIVLGTRLLTADEIPEFQRRLPLNRALAVTHANGGQTGPIFVVTNPLGGMQDGITAKYPFTVVVTDFAKSPGIMGASGEGVGIHIVGARPWRDGAKRAPTPSRRLGRCFGGFVESTPPRVFLRSADHERRQKFWDQHACRDFPAFGGLASGPRAGVCFGLQLIAEFNARPDRVARSWSHAYVVADRHQSGISHRERLPVQHPL